jgi:hypothetical protein
MRHRQPGFDRRSGFKERANLLERDGDRRGIVTRDPDPQRHYERRQNDYQSAGHSRQKDTVDIHIGLEASGDSLGSGRISIPDLGLSCGGFTVET